MEKQTNYVESVKQLCYCETKTERTYYLVMIILNI